MDLYTEVIMVKVLFGLLLVAFTLSLPFNAISRSPTDKALSSSVVIEMQHPLFGYWSEVASGTFVKDQELGQAILTAKHVAETLEGYQFNTRACALTERDDCVDLGTFVVNSETGIDEDWALYVVKRKAFDTLKVATVCHEPVDIGDELLLVGVPNSEPRVSKGILSWIEEENGDPLYCIQGYAWPGSSGGGVFDARGRLVGVMSAVAIHIDPVTGIPQTMDTQVAAVPVGNIELLD